MDGFVDNGDGTVTHKSGLVLLKNANPFGPLTWHEAMDKVATLSSAQFGLTDCSVAGDWRLPTVNELRILLKANKSTLFSNVQTNIYWSSTTNADYTSYAWIVNLNNGYVNSFVKTHSFYVWPVRSGR